MMQDRLIKLLQGADGKCNATRQCENCVGFGKGNECVNYLIAEYLLLNGVIVPPCKVDSTVYYLTTIDTATELDVTDIFCGTVQGLGFDGTNIWVSAKYTNGLYYHHKSTDFGKTVFLTREEAEAMKGGDH